MVIFIGKNPISFHIPFFSYIDCEFHKKNIQQLMNCKI